MSGVSSIETMMMAVSIALPSASMKPDRKRGGIEHEGELAALRHQHGALQRLAVTGLEQARDAVDADGLQHHEGDRR